jgi:hypothetical protein
LFFPAIFLPIYALFDDAVDVSDYSIENRMAGDKYMDGERWQQNYVLPQHVAAENEEQKEKSHVE